MAMQARDVVCAVGAEIKERALASFPLATSLSSGCREIRKPCHWLAQLKPRSISRPIRGKIDGLEQWLAARSAHSTGSIDAACKTSTPRLFGRARFTGVFCALSRIAKMDLSFSSKASLSLCVGNMHVMRQCGCDPGMNFLAIGHVT